MGWSNSRCSDAPLFNRLLLFHSSYVEVLVRQSSERCPSSTGFNSVRNHDSSNFRLIPSLEVMQSFYLIHQILNLLIEDCIERTTVATRMLLATSRWQRSRAILFQLSQNSSADSYWQPINGSFLPMCCAKHYHYMRWYRSLPLLIAMVGKSRPIDHWYSFACSSLPAILISHRGSN